MSREPKGYVSCPDEGRRIELGNFAMTVKGDADATTGLFTLLEADEPPEFGLVDVHRR